MSETWFDTRLGERLQNPHFFREYLKVTRQLRFQRMQRTVMKGRRFTRTDSIRAHRLKAFPTLALLEDWKQSIENSDRSLWHLKDDDVLS